jgi:hypothetical protein
MTKAKQSGAFKGHRFPPEIVSYAVWAYFRFSMSLRDVKDILYKRSVIFSHETIRSWVGKFGHQYTKVIRRDRPAPLDKWYLDEFCRKVFGLSRLSVMGQCFVGKHNGKGCRAMIYFKGTHFPKDVILFRDLFLFPLPGLLP